MRVTLICLLLLVGFASNVIADEHLAARLAQWMSMKLNPGLDVPQNFEKLRATFEDDHAVYPKVDVPTQDRPVVSTTSGEVTGTYEENVHTFYEIPYAQPPIAELRFQPPRAIESPAAISAIRNNKLTCMQVDGRCLLPEIQPRCKTVNMKEDCLVLNVYVPKHVNLTDSSVPPNDRLPVMVYIHGGSFAYGSGQGADGRELASVANIVLVTINYRLGALGFLVNREEGKPNIGGNQGVKDQQMALKWVQDNIANFGGDKDRVTIFGGSAGAQSVMFHTLSPNSKSLYLRAIQQSNPAYITFDTIEESQRVTDILVRRLCNDSVSTYDCLMNADPYAIVRRQLPFMVRNFLASDIHDFAEPYRPVIDDVDLIAQPMTLYKEGKWNSDKSMIIGVQTEELDDFQFLIPDVVPTGEIAFTIATYYVVGIETTDKVVKKYSEAYPPEDDDYLVAFSKQLTHLIFVCPSRAMARLASQTATGEANVYFYANEHGYPNSACAARNNGSYDGCYYATHGAEGPYVMRRKTNATEADKTVENIFNTYWGSFARTGDPSNGLETSLGDFADWESYTSGPVENVYFRKNSKFGPLMINAGKATEDEWRNIRIKAPMSELETGYEEDICDFWDSLGIYTEPIPLPTTTSTKAIVQTDPPVLDTTSGSQATSSISFISLLIPLIVSSYY